MLATLSYRCNTAYTRTVDVSSTKVVIGKRGQYGLLLPDDAAFPPVILQQVPEPKTAKTRVHFDIRVDDVEAKAAELEQFGATRIDVGQPSDAGFIPMADPEGNEFCVCPGVSLDLGSH